MTLPQAIDAMLKNRCVVDSEGFSWQAIPTGKGYERAVVFHIRREDGIWQECNCLDTEGWMLLEDFLDSRRVPKGHPSTRGMMRGIP